MSHTESWLTEKTIKKVSENTAQQPPKGKGPVQRPRPSEEVKDGCSGKRHNNRKYPGCILAERKGSARIPDGIPPQKTIDHGDALPNLHLGNHQKLCALVNEKNNKSR